MVRITTERAGGGHYRALVWDIDEEDGRRLLLYVCEAETERRAREWARRQWRTHNTPTIKLSDLGPRAALEFKPRKRWFHYEPGSKEFRAGQRRQERAARKFVGNL